MTSYDLLVVEQHDAVATVGLNRPDQRNAISDAMIAELEDYFSRPPADARVVVIHGLGEHFCAGLDLKELIAKRSTEAGDFRSSLRRSRQWHRTFDLIQYGAIPVVSVLKGAVMGGGLELASATHVRVSEPTVTYQLPEGQRGIFLGGSGSVRIPRIIGAGRVIEMMLTGRTYGQDEGLALGIAHYAVGEGEGLDKAVELARKVATNPESGNFAIVNGIARIADMATSEGMFAETMVARTAASGGNSTERITRFFEGRKQGRTEEG